LLLTVIALAIALMIGAPAILLWIAWDSKSPPALALPDSAPELTKLIGKSAADQMLATARRIGSIASESVACGIRDQKWYDDLIAGETLSTSESLERSTTTEADVMKASVQVHTRFIASTLAGVEHAKLRKRDGTCSALRATNDLQDAEQIVQRWRNHQRNNYPMR
jgi:hypothetical protein